MIAKCEAEYELLKKAVVTDPQNYWYGMPAMRYMAQFRNYFYDLILLYHTEGSSYFRDESLIDAAQRYLDALLRHQDEKGLISIYDCNISSPPDTAFRAHWFGMALRYLKKHPDEKWQPVVEQMTTFMLRAGDGLLTGGFHTANHRWVISCALAFLFELTGDIRYRARAEAFLREGLDINRSGQWSECSNSIYNAVCDIMLYHVDEIFHRPELVWASSKNLDMMKYLFHPDWCIVTEYSTRQDKAQRLRMFGEYAVVYALMAAKDQDAEYAFLFSKACEYLEDCAFFLLYQGVYDFDLPKAKPISERYHVLLNENERAGFGNRVLRHRDGKLSVTFMEKEKNNCYIQYGNVRIYGVHIVIGWFGKANIAFENMTRVDTQTYEMQTVLTGSYLDLLPERYLGNSSNFFAMQNDKRPQVGQVSITVALRVAIGESGITLSVRAVDYPNIMLQAVFLTDADTQVTGGIYEDAENTFADGVVTFSRGGDCLSVSAAGKNAFDMVDLRNYEKPAHARCLRFNFMTPCEQVFEIKMGG